MPTTRSGNAGAKAGSKHASEPSSGPSAKRAKTEAAEKEQKTIEETMEGIEKREKGEKTSETTESIEKREKDQRTIEETMEGIENDEEVKKQISEKDDTGAQNGVKKHDEKEHNGVEEGHEQRENGTKEAEKQDGPMKENSLKEGEKNAFEVVKADESEVKEAVKEEETQKTHQISNSDSVTVDKQREAAVPSSILEKGIIYFFFRGRVGIEEPEGIQDIARSFIVFRPLPLGAKRGEGPLGDPGNARLAALPKKFLPKSTRDRFLAFVEKAKTSVKDLKENFMPGSSYSTKTQGTSNVPAVTPAAEGVYAITSTGKESHIAYEITAPEIGEVQKSLGINQRGSFVVSVKNPSTSAPAGTAPSKQADYPDHIKQKFGGYRWIPLQPEFLDYENAQFLIIGEDPKGFGNALQEQEEDQKDKETAKPEEELEKLEDEDSIRVEHLKEDDPIFADLGLSSKQYQPMKSTW